MRLEARSAMRSSHERLVTYKVFRAPAMERARKRSAAVLPIVGAV